MDTDGKTAHVFFRSPPSGELYVTALVFRAQMWPTSAHKVQYSGTTIDSGMSKLCFFIQSRSDTGVDQGLMK